MKWVVIGAYLLDVLGIFTSQVAYIMMKKATIKVENSGLNGGKRKNPFLTCLWISGLLMLGLGSIFHLFALPFVDLVVLSTNYSISIVISNILSVIYLGEKVVWKYDITAVALMIGGSLTIVCLSNYDDTTYTPSVINDLLWSTSTLVFMIIFFAFIFFTVVQFIWH